MNGATTVVYLVRHAESLPSAELPEPDWPLSPRGVEQARALVPAMHGLGIRAIYSSPYPRAFHTLAPLAHALGQEIAVFGPLHERVLARRNLSRDEYWSTLQRSWADPDFALPDGESNRACACRMAAAVNEIAALHAGETIALASHGNALALYLGTLDPSFGFEAWRAMRNPDLFRVVFESDRASFARSPLPF